MLLPLLAVTTTTVLGAADDPARLLPADTLIYFGSSSIQAASEASSGTAMSKILGEAEVRAFLHEPTQAAEHVLSMALSQARSELGDGAPVEVPESFDLDISSMGALPLGEFFFGLTHVLLPGQPGAPESGMPDIGVVAGVQLLDTSHVDMIHGLWSSIPWEGGQATHAGVDYQVKMEPDSGFGVSLAVLDNMAVISVSESALHGVIDRWKGGAAGSLATSAEYRTLVEAAGAVPAGGSSHIIRMGDMAHLFQMGFMLMLQEERVEPEMVMKATQLFDSLGLDAMDLIGGVSSVGGNGRIHNTTVVGVDTQSRGLLASLAAPGETIDLSAFDAVPGNALSASAGSVGDQLVQIYDFAMMALESLEPQAHEMANAELAKIFGEASLRDDILANIQGPMLSFSLPGKGLMGQPDSYMTFSVNDSGALTRALAAMATGISEQFGSQSPFSLRQSEHEGSALFEVQLGGMLASVGAMVQPALAVRDGELVFCSSTRQLKSFLNGSVGSGDAPLSENGRFRSFASQLSGKGGLLGLSYSDNASSFGAQYTGLVGQVQMASVMLGEMPVDFTKLPTEGTISKHLDASFSGAYSPAAGVTVSRAESQFQVADILPVAVILGLAFAGQEMGMAPPPAPVEVDPFDQVQGDLRELKASVMVYKIDQGDYPTALGQLLEPLDEFPNGAYSHGALPNDPWGQAYAYEMAMHPKRKRLMPKIWSFGPNGVDDGGEGDDIVKF